MPRYFFDVVNGSPVIDLEGAELPGLNAARLEASRLVGSLLTDNPALLWNGEEWSVQVSDGRRLLLFVLHFSATESPAVSGVGRRAGP